MANREHLELLRQGVTAWNAWRAENPAVLPDLSGALLRGFEFKRADLRDADLQDADLTEADLSEAELCHANLARAKLCRANLFRADFFSARLSDADISSANLTYAILVESCVDRATMAGCHIYGMSVWNLKDRPRDQSRLVISCPGTPTITVDNIELAQFTFLLFNNKKIRDLIDTMTAKVVLILGRFTESRKAVLDAIRNEFARLDYSPIVFDFDKPSSRDLTETVSTLAHMARFIVADLTEAKSIPQELQAIVPQLPSVPIQPILETTDREYGMFEHFVRYPWVLPIHRYESEEQLVSSFSDKLIAPAERWLTTRMG